MSFLAVWRWLSEISGTTYIQYTVIVLLSVVEREGDGRKESPSVAPVHHLCCRAPVFLCHGNGFGPHLWGPNQDLTHECVSMSSASRRFTCASKQPSHTRSSRLVWCCGRGFWAASNSVQNNPFAVCFLSLSSLHLQNEWPVLWFRFLHWSIRSYFVFYLHQNIL